MTFTIGDYVHLYGYCNCGVIATAPGGKSALVWRGYSSCWHDRSTTVRRIFWDGGLLLENRHGFVRVAHPDEVCRLEQDET